MGEFLYTTVGIGVGSTALWRIISIFNNERAKFKALERGI